MQICFRICLKCELLERVFLVFHGFQIGKAPSTYKTIMICTCLNLKKFTLVLGNPVNYNKPQTNMK